MFLNNLQGKITRNQDLKKLTWFQVGGPCDVLYRPKDDADLALFMQQKPADYPFFVLGAGSNILVRDQGFKGAVLKLSMFNKITLQDDCVIAEGGVLDRTLALYLGENGYSNLEFMVGIPGSVGGALAMNAGAYGTEIKDHLLWADFMDEKGQVIRLHDFQMTYRKGNLPKGWIVLRAAFSVRKDNPAIINARLEEILNQRAQTQPIKGRTGGSTFKNPHDLSAWKLIDEAGCRGLRVGDAQISEKHCNFLLNLGAAKATEIEALGELVRQRVKEKTGVTLEWEIIRIGEAA
ncbi:MAG: UDP-N-acetylenolpyruvoylglucosamine reductase [Holosporales bacterium]